METGSEISGKNVEGLRNYIKTSLQLGNSFGCFIHIITLSIVSIPAVQCETPTAIVISLVPES